MNEKDAEFQARREEARGRVNAMDKDTMHDEPERAEFFSSVYEMAQGDAAIVPWADLEAKSNLVKWLSDNSDKKGRAVDVACGLGDNAEALADHSFDTLGFDIAPKAIEWAKERFPDSQVEYTIGDLFNLPDEWIGAFDLVNECYTLQALPSEMLDKTARAIASLVAPGGTLLIYTRIREAGDEVAGPPWPLERPRLDDFAKLGLTLVSSEEFTQERGDRLIPHLFQQWHRPQEKHA